jgi:hypothetical protein
MMARSLGILTLFALITGSGCCTTTTCGPCGQPMRCVCWPTLPKPIVWDGCGNECGPNNCQGCGDYCCGGGCGPLSHGGLFPWLGGLWSCGRGCGQVYCDEWISDPPDCCDPCDQCHGAFTGQGGGYCCLGPCQRLLAALHGYRYCAPPNSGPWRPIFGHCGYGACGDPACGCGGASPHGADVYYDGPIETSGPSVPSAKGAPVPMPEETSILDENWEIPKSAPQPGKPMHNARQPQGAQMGRAMPRQQAPPRVVSRNTAPSNTPVGMGIRRASY